MGNGWSRQFLQFIRLKCIIIITFPHSPLFLQGVQSSLHGTSLGLHPPAIEERYRTEWSQLMLGKGKRVRVMVMVANSGKSLRFVLEHTKKQTGQTSKERRQNVLACATFPNLSRCLLLVVCDSFFSSRKLLSQSTSTHVWKQIITHCLPGWAPTPPQHCP